jgi:uncharacterized membrane protein
VTWYELWLFLHISAAVLWIGGAVAVQVFGALATSSGDPARSAAFGKDTGVMVRWVFMPSSLVVLVSGILLVDEGNWDWGEWFIVLGLVGWAVVAVTAFGYLTRALKDVGMRIATQGPSPELGAEMNRLILVARVLILVLFAILFVMVVKPGT